MDAVLRWMEQLALLGTAFAWVALAWGIGAVLVAAAFSIVRAIVTRNWDGEVR